MALAIFRGLTLTVAVVVYYMLSRMIGIVVIPATCDFTFGCLQDASALAVVLPNGVVGFAGAFMFYARAMSRHPGCNVFVMLAGLGIGNIFNMGTTYALGMGSMQAAAHVTRGVSVSQYAAFPESKGFFFRDGAVAYEWQISGGMKGRPCRIGGCYWAVAPVFEEQACIDRGSGCSVAFMAVDTTRSRSSNPPKLSPPILASATGGGGSVRQCIGGLFGGLCAMRSPYGGESCERKGDVDGGTAGLCLGPVNTCRFAHDGECDDGGPNTKYSGCARGTDCSDCSQAEGESNSKSCAMARTCVELLTARGLDNSTDVCYQPYFEPIGPDDAAAEMFNTASTMGVVAKVFWSFAVVILICGELVASNTDSRHSEPIVRTAGGVGRLL